MANIGKSITIVGDVTGEEDLVLDGTVQGKIELPDHALTIGPNGSAEGELFAKAVTVVGSVLGDIQATERILIEANGHVEGDIEAPRLMIREGAVVNGRMSTNAPSGVPTPAPKSAVRAQRPQPVAKLDQPSPKASASPKAAASSKPDAPKLAASVPKAKAKS